jgi:hypothetical protein
MEDCPRDIVLPGKHTASEGSAHAVGILEFAGYSDAI